MRRTLLVLLVLLLFFALAGIEWLVALYTDWLWFGEVGYRAVFAKILLSRLAIALVAGGVTFALVYGNVFIARRLTPRFVLETPLSRLLRSDIVLRYLDLLLLVFSLLLSFILAQVAAESWPLVLRYLNRVSFGVEAPIFARDVSFFVFVLPFYRHLQAWLLGLLVLAALMAGVVHWFGGAIQIEQNYRRIAPEAKAHLSVLAGLVFLVVAWRYLLRAYDLLFSARGIIFGAGYADIRADLPVLRILAIVSVIVAALFIANLRSRGWRLPVIGVSLLLGVSILGGGIYPFLLQRFRVEPNELALERPYIKMNIDFTRRAYGLDKVEERAFPVEDGLNAADIERNQATIENIRLWDWRPLLKTYQQIQSIRLYYEFKDVDIDRYVIGGKYKQVTLSGRELLLDRLPENAKTWVNEHLVYTHGYGVVLNEVSQVTEEGLPRLVVSDIPPVTRVSNLRLMRPQLYFGEEPSGYSIVKTKTREFDYPKGDENQYTVYEGSGGVPMSSFLTKAAFAWRFGGLRLLLSGALTPQSRILFYKNIRERLERIAPFLSYDSDPYLVIDNGRLFWIVDAYTMSDRYPYSKPFAGGDNYIRNSVKVVVDAYNGTTTFYQIDTADPVVRAYARMFPGLFHPLNEMPDSLKRHIRYPEGLFTIQANMYATFHMRDPQVFFGKEDQWDIPNEIFGETQQRIEPYYVIIRLPGEEREEFMIITPFTPSNKNNMIAWMAARSDFPGYGGLVVFKFPKRKLVFGPMQIEARIDQSPAISQQLTLWGQRGSRAIRGNLLVIPIEQSLIYVEPLYLQAEQTELPELARVIASHGPKVAMETTLDGVLGAVVLGRPPAPAPEVPPAAPPAATVQNLINTAVEQFNRAQDALRRGDFAAYGEEIRRLQATLRALESQAAK